MSDFETDPSNDDVSEAEAEASEATEKGTKAKPSFGLQIVGASLPEQEKAKRGGAGRGPDMRLHKLLTELATLDPKNEAGEAEWALLVTYTTASGARETLKSIEEGNRPVPEGLTFEYDVRRWDAEVPNGKGEVEKRRVSGLFAKFTGGTVAAAAESDAQGEAGVETGESVSGEAGVDQGDGFDSEGFPV